MCTIKTTIIELENQAGQQFSHCEPLITQAVHAAVTVAGPPRQCAVYVQLVDDATIHQINLQTRDINQPTDVLSFPLSTPGWDEIDPQTGALMLGDIIISMQRVQQQAEEYGHTLAREAAYLAAHGTLHLLGYDHMHKQEQQHMRTLEEAAMAQLGLSRKASGKHTWGEGHAKTQPKR